MRVIGELRVVLENRRASDSLEVIDRRGQTDRAGDVRRAGFESVRRFLERAFLERNADDHFAAAMPRRHCIENFRAAIERADAGRSAHFVSGEGEEIATEFLHIERHMSGALRGIDQRDRADRARLSAKLRHRIDRA